MSGVRFAILGPLAVTHRGAPIRLEQRGIRRRLLATLLVNAGVPVTDEKLANWVWGGEDEGFREGRLQPAVSRLRTTLSVTGDKDRILRVDGGYVLDLDNDELDAFVFDDLRRQAHDALGRGDPRTAVEISDRALALWRGAALSGFADEGFAVERAAQLDAARLVARQVRIEALLAVGGQDAEVVAEAEELLAAEQDNEAVLRVLMLALHRSQRTGTAQARYRDYVMAIEADGRRPGIALTSLAAAIAENDPTLMWQPPAGRAHLGDRGGAALRTFVATVLVADGSSDAGPSAAARTAHDHAVREVVETRDGRAFGEAGPGASAAFERPIDAILAARDLAIALQAGSGNARNLRVRMAVHTGEAGEVGPSFRGPALRRVVRLRDAGHPGQVIVSAATRELVAEDLPEDLRLAAIGACLFTGSTRLERVFQLVGPGLASEFPPLRSPRRPAGQLPRYATAFVGRHQEVTDVSGLLARPGLVTLTGDGGIGKTRLAVEVAARVTNVAWADGVWYCDVSVIDDVTTLVERLAAIRGLAASPGGNPRAELIRSFEGAELLLVLDGCEHLREPVRDLVAEIVESAPDVRILATSRGRLDVRDEQVKILDPLSIQGPSDREPELAPAVLLLRDRAARSGAHLSPSDRKLVELARRLEGLPLAIELVASMLSKFTPATIVERLDRCLDRATLPDAPKHQRTLEATFDWSFDLLSPSAARLFAALSLFRDPWSLETAEAVAPAVEVAPDDVMTLTTELLDQSLVRLDQAADGTARYTMLDSIRRYGNKRLHLSDRYDDVADLHARHFLALVERAVQHRRGPDEPAWVGELGADFDDMRAAYRRFVDTGRPQDALRLTLALTDDLLMRELIEIGRWATELAVLPELASHPRLIEAKGLAATAAMLEVRLDDAVALAIEARDAEGPTAAEKSWTARNVLAMMTAIGQIEDDNPWTDHLRVMEDISEEIEDPFPEALALWDRAFVAKWTSELQYADEPATQLVALGDRYDNSSIRSMGYLGLAWACSARGEHDEASDLLRRAQAAAELARNRLVLSQIRREMADLRISSDGSVTSLADLRGLLQWFRDTGNEVELHLTALSIAEGLEHHDHLVPAMVTLGTLQRVLQETPRFEALLARVDARLTEDQRSEVQHKLSGMHRAGLADYLVDIVNGLIR